jgi:DNA helicase-2/ATP-dependent DNA helicase PcrA
LTVHASKGLEFEEVYVVDLMEGRFPNHKLISKGSSLDEERRLFYVAVTRAKDILYLSFATNDSLRDISYAPSCFLYEAKLLK